ncbi:MAG: ABC transporter substrate-binding protein [Candidatus Lustribacter sp.]|jgi:NitT/TauT family transport system substrate-binding protein
MTSRRAFLASAAAAAAVPHGLDAQQLIHLSVGTAPIDAGMPPIIAQKTGIFRRNGLDVDVQVLNSGAAATAALVGGALNASGTSVMGVIAAHLKGVPFQIIAPASLYVSDKPSELLVVKKDSPYRTGADLNGKTIASPALGDLFSITTMAWVDQNGGDSRTLHEIELPPSATPAAISTGRIDAAVLTEPLLSQTINAGITRVLGKPYDAIAPRFMIAAVVAMADYINANRDAIQRLARSLLEANAFGNAHPDQTAPWLSEITHVDVATIERGHRELFDEALIVGNLQRVIDAAARYKAIDHAFDARDLISPIVLGIKP